MKKCIVFTGGGTGGHVFPALAVYEELVKKWDGRIIWIGSNSGMEKKIVKEWSIPYYGILTGKIRRYFSIRNFIDIFNVFAGLIYAFFIILKERPCVIFSKGGYVSVPPVIAGSILKIPVLTHESDIDPGLATRINTFFSQKVLVSYKETKKYFNQANKEKYYYTGNPVRSIIMKGNPQTGRKILGCPADRKIILVLGGSQGAVAINRAIAKILDKLTKKYFVVHQMGVKNFRKKNIDNYFPSPFFNKEMTHILSASDLVVSRAGANTLWELATTGKPSILIPLSLSGSRGDQIKNARLFSSFGASRLLLENDQLSEKLLESVLHILDNKEILKQMAKKALQLGKPGAAKNIADLILKVIKG